MAHRPLHPAASRHGVLCGLRDPAPERRACPGGHVTVRLEIGDMPSRGVLLGMRQDIDAALRTMDQADALLVEHDAAGGNVDHREECLDSMTAAQRHAWMLVNAVANAASQQTIGRWLKSEAKQDQLDYWAERMTEHL
jgi:hypothetical protein